jgi:hypothetical protein
MKWMADSLPIAKAFFFLSQVYYNMKNTDNTGDNR